MRASLDTRLLSSYHLYLTLTLFSPFSHLSSPLPSSSCELQAEFDLNRMHKAGGFTVGGLFPLHYYAVFPELSFTSKPQDPTCYG